jgi:hypothetical protein
VHLRLASDDFEIVVGMIRPEPPVIPVGARELFAIRDDLGISIDVPTVFKGPDRTGCEEMNLGLAATHAFDVFGNRRSIPPLRMGRSGRTFHQKANCQREGTDPYRTHLYSPPRIPNSCDLNHFGQTLETRCHAISLLETQYM